MVYVQMEFDTRKNGGDYTSRLIDLTGMKFGRLTVLYRVGETGEAKWHCICDCGKEIDVCGHFLRSGEQKSCGCYSRDMARERLTTHGQSKTKLYHVWHGMKQRCYYQKHISYQFYGALGIGVCDEWRNDYMKFYEWAMESGYEAGLSIDRIDDTKGYSPENCRWVTPTDQACNRRTNLVFEYNGKKQVLKQWANELGINYLSLYSKIKRGVPFEEAISA